MGLIRKLKRQSERAAREAPAEKKLRVLVVVTSADGKVVPQMADFLMTLTASMAAKSLPWEMGVQVIRSERPVERARNLAVRAALDGGYDKLLFLDDDQAPTQSVFKLIAADGDIVAGWTLTTMRDATDPTLPALLPNVYVRKDEAATAFVPVMDAPYGSEALMDVDAAGTALLCIDRRVLEDRRLWAPLRYFDVRYGEERELDLTEPGVGYPVFQTHYLPDGKVLRSEDISFSWRAKQLGYRVRCHLGVYAGHIKAVDLMSMATMTSAAVRRAAGRENAA